MQKALEEGFNMIVLKTRPAVRKVKYHTITSILLQRNDAFGNWFIFDVDCSRNNRFDFKRIQKIRL